MSYSAILALPTGADPSPQRIAGLLGPYLSKSGEARVAIEPEGVQLSWSDWALRIWIVRDPELLADMKSAVQEITGGDPQAALFHTADTLLEVAGDDDPEMDHFNDYMLLAEALVAAYPGSVGVDMAGGEIWQATEATRQKGSVLSRFLSRLGF